MASLRTKSGCAIASMILWVGCSTTASETVYTAALRRLCEMQDFRSAVAVELIDLTRPTALQLPALRLMANPSPLTGEDLAALTAAEEKLLHSFNGELVTAPAGTTCVWRVSENRDRYSEMLRVELSPVVPADVAANQSSGIFARVSAGGRPGAEFFWLPIIDLDARKVGPPVRLSIDDG